MRNYSFVVLDSELYFIRPIRRNEAGTIDPESLYIPVPSQVSDGHYSPGWIECGIFLWILYKSTGNLIYIGPKNTWMNPITCNLRWFRSNGEGPCPLPPFGILPSSMAGPGGCCGGQWSTVTFFQVMGRLTSRNHVLGYGVCSKGERLTVRNDW